MVAFGGTLAVAVGLLKRLVSKGEEGVAAGTIGVMLPPVLPCLASLGETVVVSRTSSVEMSMLSWSVTDGLPVTISPSTASELLLVFVGERNINCCACFNSCCFDSRSCSHFM